MKEGRNRGSDEGKCEKDGRKGARRKKVLLH